MLRARHERSEGIPQEARVREGRPLVGPRGLKTYDTITKTGGAVDKAQTRINWNKAKSTTVQTYMKSTIDDGRPVLVGVNVRGEANKINEGLTDHFVLVYGYRVQLVAGAWAITAFFAVDNAAFEGGSQSSPLDPGSHREAGTSAATAGRQEPDRERGVPPDPGAHLPKGPRSIAL